MTSECFDQLRHLKTFTESRLNHEQLASSPARQKWTKNFENSLNGDCHSELLQLPQAAPVILRHSAMTDSSSTQTQQTKKRNVTSR
jgi:hypothetical protein